MTIFEGIPEWFWKPVRDWFLVNYGTGAIAQWHIAQRTVRRAWQQAEPRLSLRVRIEGVIS